MKLKKTRLSLLNKPAHLKFRGGGRPIIGISLGDPSGIGPEVIAKAITDPQVTKSGKIVIIGDRFVLSKTPGFSSQFVNGEIIDLKNVPQENFSFGKISRIYGEASIKYLNFAIDLIKAKRIDCLVTGPISKEAINLAGYKYSGHTEYLKRKTKAKKIAMMFVAGKLRVSLVTRHLSLRQAIEKIDSKKIFEAIMLTHNSLKKQFRIKNPRIGVCGLNPHAGEAGLFGSEEEKIILPAIQEAKRRYGEITGPFAADTIFHQALNNKFDAVIAMYHDQGLIPLKTLFSKMAVNVTLGLPFVRTSPSHGTAFDIAGRNIADPTSMKEAIKLASHLCQR